MQRIVRNIWHFFIQVLPVVFICSWFSSQAQNNRIDSLRTAISNTKEEASLMRLNGALASEYIDLNQYAVALKFYKEALKYAEKAGSKEDLALYNDNVGLMHDNLGNYSECMKYTLKALEIYTELDNQSSIANSYNNLGVLYYYQSNYTDAMKYYHQSYALAEELNDWWLQASLKNNIGNIYSDSGNQELALKNYFESAEISIENGDSVGAALVYGNIGETYTVLKEFEKAEEYLLKAKGIYERNENNQWGVVNQYRGLGDLEFERGNALKSFEYYKIAARICEESGLLSELSDAYLGMAEALKTAGKAEEAYEYILKYRNTQDSLFSITSAEKVNEMQALYDVEQKEKQLSLKNSQLEKQKLQKRLYIGAAIGVLIILGFTVYSLNQKRKDNRRLQEQQQEISEKNEELNQQNEEIIAISDKIDEQNSILTRQNTSILDSIAYAQRIQHAILPPAEKFKQHLPDSFVYYKPKDIVSGDFFWMESVGDKILWAVVDCTGHGVPGAFMSIVGANGLKKIVLDDGILKPSEILEALTKYVVESVVDPGDGTEVKDGMDVALCCWDKSTNTLEYAGAFNPLYLIRNGEMHITKGTRRPVGNYFKRVNKPFINHEFKVLKGDVIYLFSDGFADQFGGDSEFKFTYKRFRELLLNIHEKDMNEQQTILEETYENWRGNVFQLDDICIIGVRI